MPDLFWLITQSSLLIAKRSTLNAKQQGQIRSIAEQKHKTF